MLRSVMASISKMAEGSSCFGIYAPAIKGPGTLRARPSHGKKPLHRGATPRTGDICCTKLLAPAMATELATEHDSLQPCDLLTTTGTSSNLVPLELTNSRGRRRGLPTSANRALHIWHGLGGAHIRT